VTTQIRRQRRRNIQEAVALGREFANIDLQSEQVAEFNYPPTGCCGTYRMASLSYKRLARKLLTLRSREVSVGAQALLSL